MLDEIKKMIDEGYGFAVFAIVSGVISALLIAFGII